jgi:PAT family beta-lactamase induction signal transducer AmpG
VDEGRSAGEEGATPLRRKLAWIGLLYFAEGLPFAIVKDVVPVYMRVLGLDLAQIGYASLLGLPWTLKVLWSPLVDRGDRRRWLSACLLALAALAMAIGAADPRAAPALFWLALFAFTCASATQDIAIDAYTIGILRPGEEGDANGVRVSAYRGALIVGGGALVAISAQVGWRGVYALAAMAFLALAAAAARAPAPALHGAGGGGWLAAMRGWLGRPGAWSVLLFVLIYKLGDAAMAPMIKPFWVDRGLSVEEIGLVSTSLGVAAAIGGALVGGRLTSRWGIVPALLVLGAAQALSNLGYAGVAWLDAPRPSPLLVAGWSSLRGAALLEPGRAWIWAASLLESFTGGLGTAAFISFLMNICDKRHAAVQYAFLSAVFALSRDVAGAASGRATEQLGYDVYFFLTFALALPSLALLPSLRGWVSDRPPPLKEDPGAR